ncbi:neural cell adhesion molecule 2-like [Arctopsyche grandis]|uniref:neural cell adhesion molecule 2-like n=1 Tax=Arctopsyche grandis TaxID=121162 RepID=UPI00406DA21D
MKMESSRPKFAKILVFVVGLSHLIMPMLSVILDKQVRTVDVEAVEGKVAEFPCDINSGQHDKVHIVFWFKDDAGIPLYSFDVRGVGTSEGRHWSAPGVFGPRAHFRAAPPPAVLLLKDVKRHDEGIYRCRVDYRNTQTVSFRYNFTVIVPPGIPLVIDRSTGALNSSSLGPKEEGDDLLLTCTVQGGRPSPTVRWLVNGILVDVEYEHNTGDVIENRLSWPAIGRQDYGSIFTCQAINSPLVEPKEASFTLDMNLKPLTISIAKTEGVLSAGRRYVTKCTASGSRPAAIITWHKGKRQLKRTKDETKDNVTISELTFVPSIDDDERLLVCRAENPNLSTFLETSWKLEVVYPPQVSLALGNTLSSDDIKEGDDVYFECHVVSNPPWRKLTWMHNGALVNHNTSARVVRSNQSLVLQKVTRQSSGRYSCSAINPEGETISDEFILRVKYTPICKNSGPVAIGAARGEELLVTCEVDADPPARSFKWKFNNSGETMDVGANKFTSNGSLSILRYVPLADLDFGTLSCTAINDVGNQMSPCIFQLVAAGKPQPLTNCTLNNITSGAAEVACEAGFDGGLPQHFLIEVYTNDKPDPIYNISNTEALFTVPLEIGMTLRLEVYAVNAKGRSPAAILVGVHLGDPDKQAAAEEKPQVPVWIGALIGGVVSLLILILIVACQVKRSCSNERIPRQNSGKAEPRVSPPQLPQPNLADKYSHTDLHPPNDILADDRDPDIIPVNYEPPTLYARTWGSGKNFNSDEFGSENLNSHGLVVTNRIQFNGDSSLNIQAFKEKLLDTRLPESCV